MLVSGIEVNEREVERRKERLLSAHDDGVAVVEERTNVPTDAFPELIEGSEDGYIGAAYVWVVRQPGEAVPLSDSMPAEAIDDRKRVLMILGHDGEAWGLPGGGREIGETFEETAVREVREETGIECAATDLFLLRHRVTTAEGFAERLHTLWVFFDGVYETGTIAIQASELNGAAWFAEPPERMRPENERRAEGWSEG